MQSWLPVHCAIDLEPLWASTPHPTLVTTPEALRMQGAGFLYGWLKPWLESGRTVVVNAGNRPGDALAALHMGFRHVLMDASLPRFAAMQALFQQEGGELFGFGSG
jgi:hypothetical protein